MNALRILTLVFIVLASLGFILGIWTAVRCSLRGAPSDMPAFLRLVVTTIGGVLATNFGAVLGIKVEAARASGLGATAYWFAAPSDSQGLLQYGAACVYLVGLLLALAGWGKLRFTEDPNRVVAMLPQLTLTLLGVGAGVLAVALGTPAA